MASAVKTEIAFNGNKSAEIVFILLLTLSSLGYIYIAFGVNVLAVIFLIVKSKCKVGKELRNLLLPFFILFVFGIAMGIGYPFYDLMKDAWYLIKVIIALSLGYMIMRYVGSLRELCRVVVLAAAISSAFHFFQITMHANEVGDIFYSEFLFQVRESYGVTGSLLSVFGLIVLIFYKNFLYMPIVVYIVSALFCSLSLVLSMSRTYIVVFAVMAIVMLGWRSRFLMAFILCCSAMAVLVLDREEQLFDKFSSSANEIAIEEYFEMSAINRNWRGFEAYRALVAYVEGDFGEQIFGQGFGALIDLGIVMKLGGNDIRMIPITHNGYLYVLVKFGVIGLFVYFYFIYRLIRKSREIRRVSQPEIIAANRLMSGTGWLILLTTAVITGVFNIFILDSSLMIVGALASISSNRMQHNIRKIGWSGH